MLQVPFLDLKRQYRAIKAKIDDALRDVLESGNYILGKQVEAFEEEFALWCGTKFAVGVSSGTDALTLALLATNTIVPGRGDEVITSALSASFTAIAILQAGAVPVFVDVHSKTLNIDPGKIEASISPKTKVIIPVHLYGQPADLAPIEEIAAKYHLKIIEDACQAHGTLYHRKKVGKFGIAAAFSFYPTKNLGGYGDGGMVVTDDENVFKRIKILRNGGKISTGDFIASGRNSRMDEMQAAILRVKLSYLDRMNEERRRLASIYSSGLNSLGLVLPEEMDHTNSVYHLYVIRHPERDSLRQHLSACGVETLVHYPIPLHRQKAFPRFQEGQSLPVVEQSVKEILSLPLYPGLTEEEINYVICSIKRFKTHPKSK